MSCGCAGCGGRVGGCSGGQLAGTNGNGNGAQEPGHGLVPWLIGSLLAVLVAEAVWGSMRR